MYLIASLIESKKIKLYLNQQIRTELRAQIEWRVYKSPIRVYLKRAYLPNGGIARYIYN